MLITKGINVGMTSLLFRLVPYKSNFLDRIMSSTGYKISKDKQRKVKMFVFVSQYPEILSSASRGHPPPACIVIYSHDIVEECEKVPSRRPYILS